MIEIAHATGEQGDAAEAGSDTNAIASAGSSTARVMSTMPQDVIDMLILR